MDKIKLEEREKYKDIVRGLARRTKLEVSDKIILKCKDGIIVETDILANDATIINKDGKKLLLSSLVPEGYHLKISKMPWWADCENKTIFVPMIHNEIHLVVWIHEIGHSWDFSKNEEEYIEKGLFIDRFKRSNKKAVLLSRIERAAWAWCLRTLRVLKKDGFISSKLNNKVLIEITKASLFSYAESFQKVKKHKLFLNKEL
jgi:hypothetical protein